MMKTLSSRDNVSIVRVFLEKKGSELEGMPLSGGTN